MTNWIENHKLTAVIIVMIIIWGSLFWYFITYAESIVDNPCSICAARMGDDVHCTTKDSLLSSIIFYKNGSIVTKYPDRAIGLNSSNFEVVT